MEKTANRSQPPRKVILEYDILRVIVTMLVVIGHCYYYSIFTEYGGINYSEYINPNTISLKIIQMIMRMIYDFHMPLFMALSGALFYKSKKKGRYVSEKEIIADKFPKLMIPFFIVTLFYSLPLKFFFGYWETSETPLRDIIVGQIFIQGNTHLWYLVALFEIFIIVNLLENKLKDHHAVKLAAMGIMYIASFWIPVKLISLPLEYCLWFYSGFVFESVREKVNEKIRIKHLIISVVIFIPFFFINLKHFNGLFEKISNLITGVILIITGSAAVYIISFLLTSTGVHEHGLFKLISKNSFPMYLYADGVNYVLLFLAFTLFGSIPFSTNIGFALLFTARLVISSIIGILMGELLRKLNLKNLC